MGINEIFDIIKALQAAKNALEEAFQDAKEGRDDETYLGALAILAEECAEYHAIYEKEAAELPELEGVEW